MAGAQVIALEIQHEDAEHPFRARRRESRVAVTRRRLVGAAFLTFARAGYHGTSMADVARAAELSQGAAYNHFDGKEALFAATFEAFNPFDRLVDDLLALDHSRSKTSRDFEQQLRTALERFELPNGQTTTTGRDWFDLLLIDVLEFGCQHWSALYARLRPAFARASGRLEASGRLNSIGGAAAFRSVMAATLGERLVTRLLAAGEGEAGRQAPGSGVLDIFLRGVLAESA